MANILRYLKHLFVLVAIALIVPTLYMSIIGGHPVTAGLLVMAIGLGIASPAVLIIAGYCLWLERTNKEQEKVV